MDEEIVTSRAVESDPKLAIDNIAILHQKSPVLGTFRENGYVMRKHIKILYTPWAKVKNAEINPTIGITRRKTLEIWLVPPSLSSAMNAAKSPVYSHTSII